MAEPICVSKRCPYCDRRLFDKISPTTGTISIKCPQCKNVVVINAAFAIQTLEAGKMPIEECIAKAKESIESGKALERLKKFVEINC